MGNTSDPRPARRDAREFPVVLDRDADASLPVQLAAALREVIDVGTLRPGEQVPATRELARRIGVARGVVVAAYEQLIAEGYLVAARGRGTEVNPGLATAPDVAGEETESNDAARTAGEVTELDDVESVGPLAPGAPMPSAIDSPAWRSAWRDAAAHAHLVAPALGERRLREEIADHLRRMRSTPRPASDVLVTAGTRDGLGLLLTALGTTHGRSLVVGVEDPGLPSLRGVAARHGAQIVALPTDSYGLNTSALPDGMLDVVIVTPSHQYPLGGSLPLVRRRELLAWARARGVIVVEDDFDSELRYTGSPLPALAALDDPVDGVVVLLGTFSRTISPALSAGYLLAPRSIRGHIEPVRTELGGPVSSVVQIALAHYLASGELRRHTVRLLRRYAERRDLVSERLAGIPGVRVRPMDGGLHAVIEFVAEPSRRVGNLSRGDELRQREARAVTAANERGLGVSPLGGYWQRQGAGASGLVIGMGGSDDAEFDAALVTLAGLLRGDLRGELRGA